MKRLSETRDRWEKHIPLITFFLSFAFFLLICWCAPYSSDDLEFGNLSYETFPEIMTFVLEYGNGRLLGNLCAIWLSGSRIMCVLVKAGVMASLVVLLPGVLGLKGAQMHLLSFLLVNIMEPNIYGEVFAWTSGFSNYTPPIWMALVIVYLLRRYPELPNAGWKIAVGILVAVLGIAAQLFIEHSSGVNLLLAALMLAVFLKRREKGRTIISGIWLIAALAGLVLMLAIPVLFFNEEGRAVGYRSVRLSSIVAMVVSCGKNVIQLSNHHFGACTMPMLFGSFATVYLTRGSRSEKVNHRLYGINGLVTVYLLLSMALSLETYLGKSAVIQHAFSGVAALTPYVIWVISAFRLEDRKLRWTLVVILAFALISLLPLLVVSPIPTRVVFQAHIFVILGALVCADRLWALPDPRWKKVLVRGTAGVCLVLAVLLSTVFLSIRFMAQARENHIRGELDSGAEHIVIFNLPYAYTSWDHLWSQGFLNDTGREVTFEVMPFDSWMHEYMP